MAYQCEECGVTGINFVSTEAVELRWRFREDFVEPSGKTNVVFPKYPSQEDDLFEHLNKCLDL